MLSEDSKRVLVERIRRGDKAACAECVERRAPGVYRVALRLTGNEAEAEEAVQEMFLSAFKAIDQFEGRSGLATWCLPCKTEMPALHEFYLKHQAEALNCWQSIPVKVDRRCRTSSRKKGLRSRPCSTRIKMCWMAWLLTTSKEN